MDGVDIDFYHHPRIMIMQSWKIAVKKFAGLAGWYDGVCFGGELEGEEDGRC